MLQGVDLSHWQGEVDFAKMVKAGIKFAFFKFTEGTDHVDDRGLQYLQGALAESLLCGAYHYFLPKYDPIEQADHFLAVITAHEKEAGGKLMLPPVIDVEVKASAAKLQETILAFLEHVEQVRGVTPIVYTSPGFWRSYAGKCEAIVRYPLWVAHYGTSYPSQFYPWAGWKFWQFTSAGSIPGCAANVDLNLFPGDWLELLKLCGIPKVEEYSVSEKRCDAKSPMVKE